VVACAAATLALATAWIRLGPLPQDLLEPAAGVSTIVYDRSGEILYEARAGDGSRSMRLSAAALPQALADATVAAEDHRFWRHPGVDPIALVRAAVRNLRARAVVEGGSTITQQTVKLLLAGSEGTMPTRSVRAKLREAVLALRLEHRLTKREILALYLNTASYGNQLTGAERASRAYFGGGTSVLTPAQAAFLAALPQRPTTLNPYRDPSRARRRQEGVIVQMGVQRLLSPEQVREALDERLTLVREPAVFVAPHFVQRVLAQAARPGHDGEKGHEGQERRISAIHTTLDADLQRIVQGIIRAERPALTRIGAHNVAVVVLANESAEWLAWEGSGDYADRHNGGAIDGVTTPRQPGSALKPFTYAAAFEDGATPASVLPDVPSFFPTARDGVLYAPRNYDNRFRGPLLARRALAGSENVPAVALASRVGVPTLLRLLRGAGLTTFDKNAAYYGLGLTLGDAEVRLDELVAAYSMFARGGVFVRPRLIRSSADRCGVSKCNGGRDSETAFHASSSPDPVPAEPAASERLVSPRTAFWITDILSDNEARAYVFGRGGSLEFPFPVAAKTGTSQAYHDNWAIGYTQDVTVGVWVGNFDRRPLTGSSGVAGAGPIFHAVMVAATDATRGSEFGTSKFAISNQQSAISNEKETICALSGMRASAWCPTQTEEWTAGDSSTGDQECTWHVPRSGGVAVKWPQEYVAWARTQGVYDRVTPPPTRAGDLLGQARRVGRTPVVIAASAPAAARAGAPALRVVSPPDGAVYLIDPTLRRAFQTLALRAAAAEPANIEWRIDGRAVGRGAAGASIDWPLTAGAHVVTARDASGREASAAIVVK